MSQLGPIVQDLLRQHSLQGALVYEFCIRQAPDFQPRWDCGRVLHKPVVEEGQPALDREGAQQTQPSEIETYERMEIAVETAAQLVLAAGLTVDSLNDVEDLVQVTGLKKISGAQRLQLLRRVVDSPPVAQELRRKGETVGKSLDLDLKIFLLVAVRDPRKLSREEFQDSARDPIHG